MSPISITLRAYMVPDTMDVSGMGHVAFTCVVVFLIKKLKTQEENKSLSQMFPFLVLMVKIAASV